MKTWQYYFIMICCVFAGFAVGKYSESKPELQFWYDCSENKNDMMKLITACIELDMRYDYCLRETSNFLCKKVVVNLPNLEEKYNQ